MAVSIFIFVFVYLTAISIWWSIHFARGAPHEQSRGNGSTQSQNTTTLSMPSYTPQLSFTPNGTQSEALCPNNYCKLPSKTCTPNSFKHLLTATRLRTPRRHAHHSALSANTLAPTARVPSPPAPSLHTSHAVNTAGPVGNVPIQLPNLFFHLP